MVLRPHVLFLGGGTLILAGILVALSLAGPAPIEEIRLPAQLGGLARVEARTGGAAEAEIQRLHRRAIPLTSAAVARYGAAAEATLWVGGTAGQAEAAMLLEAMRDALESSEAPFIPLEPQVISGVTVFPLRGMGQEHMIFQSGPLVVWLAADVAVAEAARRSVVEAFP